MATQRAHNFKMSYEGGGTQFLVEKRNLQDPYKLPAAASVGASANADLGKSNRHSVQIGHNARAPEFESMTMQQQGRGAARTVDAKAAEER